MDDRSGDLTIIVRLPQPLDNVTRLLTVVADTWPNAVLDVSGPWTIEVPPIEH